MSAASAPGPNASSGDDRLAVGLAGGLGHDRLVDAIEFVAEVLGDVVEGGEQVGHPRAEHLDQRRQFAGLAVGVFVGEFAPAVLQQGAHLQFAGDRCAVVLHTEVDMPAAVAGLLGLLDVVAFGGVIDAEGAFPAGVRREVLERHLDHLEVAEVGAGEAHADQVVEDARDVVDARDLFAVVGLADLAPGAPLRLDPTGDAADAGEVAVGQRIVELALQCIHRPVERGFERVGTVGVVPVSELGVAERVAVAVAHRLRPYVSSGSPHRKLTPDGPAHDSVGSGPCNWSGR